jgi:hypothetical protein
MIVAEWPEHLCLIPEVEEVFLFASATESEQLWGPPTLLFNGYRGIFVQE